MALETTVRTEFMRLLDQDAEFRGEVRRHLLTAELIELPERFAAFAARVDEFIIEQRAINARVDQRLDGMDQRFDGIDQRLDGMDARLQAITNDLGDLKGHAAGRAARDHAETLPDLLGLAHVTTLNRRDLVGLLAPAASEIAAGDRQSFFRADLVVEARAADGSACGPCATPGI